MKPRFHADLRRTAEEISGLKVPYAPAKRKPLRWRWYLILAVVSAPLVYFGLSGAYSLAVISAPASLMLKQYELRSAIAGYVKRMEVQVGMRWRRAPRWWSLPIRGLRKSECD